MMRSLSRQSEVAGTPQRPRQDGRSVVGLRRVDWVQITIEDGQTRFEVVGVGHRRPVTRKVPVHVAAALIASGTPSVFRRPPSGRTS